MEPLPIRPRSIVALTNEARRSLTRGLHSRMRWQNVEGTANGGKVRCGQCTRCGGTVTLLTKPQPNEIDVAGTAIGQDCNTLLQSAPIPSLSPKSKARLILCRDVPQPPRPLHAMTESELRVFVRALQRHIENEQNAIVKAIDVLEEFALKPLG